MLPVLARSPVDSNATRCPLTSTVGLALVPVGSVGPASDARSGR